jgi:hypothetical protein
VVIAAKAVADIARMGLIKKQAKLKNRQLDFLDFSEKNKSKWSENLKNLNK